MGRKVTTVVELDLSVEEWANQEPCPKCGQRPGRNPTTGVEVKDGHRDWCTAPRAK